MSDSIKLHVTEWGSGPLVVMIHGGDQRGGRSTFSAQEPLAERFHQVPPDRPGSGRTPKAGRADFEQHAELILPLLEDGPTHLVGHSYGAVIATWIATRHPQRVKSLALFEPPLFSVAPDDAEVVAMASVNRDLVDNPPADPATMIRDFFIHVGIRPPANMPPMSPEAQMGLARELATMRSPAEADITLNRLRTGGWPIRVMTSGKTPGFEGIARAIASLPGAEQIIVPNVDHNTQKKRGSRESHPRRPLENGRITGSTICTENRILHYRWRFRAFCNHFKSTLQKCCA